MCDRACVVPGCKEPVIAELVRNRQEFPNPVFVCAKHASDPGVNEWFDYPHWQLLLPFEGEERAGECLEQSPAGLAAERVSAIDYVDARIRQLSECASPFVQDVLHVLRDHLAG